MITWNTWKDSGKQNSSTAGDEGEKSKREDLDEDLKAILALYKATNQKAVQKWDHNGFLMLYPEGLTASKSTSAVFTESKSDQPEVSVNIDNLKKWDHAGYNILYDNKKDESQGSKTRHKKSHKK